MDRPKTSKAYEYAPLSSKDKVKISSSLHLPSFQNFDKHKGEIVDLENELYEV